MLLPKIFILSILLLSCTSQKDQPGISMASKFKSGTVKDMRGLDGCAFLILLNSGKTLQPINLDQAYKQDDLKIELTFTGVEGMSTCMKGEMVQINEIKKIK